MTPQKVYSDLLGCCLSRTISKADRLLYILACCLSRTISKADRLTVHLRSLPIAHYQQPVRSLYILACCLSRTISKADCLTAHRGKADRI